MLSRSTALYEEMGASIPSYDMAERERTPDLIRRELDEAAFAEAWEQGRTLRLNEVELALAEAR